MLEIKNLTCSRNDKTLFRGLAFNVEAGTAVQIVGSNGAGKTTLLRTIAGIVRPLVGQIERHNLDVCYIGHKPALHPDLTVQQNLEFLHVLEHGKRGKEELAAALEYFAIKNKYAVNCSELSAGQIQRVSLARLCFSKAKLWLLDEPLANLDKHAGTLLNKLCIGHLQTGGIMVVATHNNLDFTPMPSSVVQLEEYR